MRKKGEPAPDFVGVTQEGSRIRLSDFKGRNNVVLYFYPGDFTPGCTAQACSFRDNLDLIAGFNAVLIGVSGDGKDSHARFSKAHNLEHVLIDDSDGRVAQMFGVTRIVGPVKRVTFVIDREGMIREVIHHEFAIGWHIRDILSALRMIVG